MQKLATVAINARVTAFAMGGQQRVAHEIIKRLPGADLVMPSKPLNGLKGHVWEQLVLPARALNRVVWSPSATGPLLHRKQVVTVHDTAFFDTPEFFSPSFVKLYQFLVPKLVRRVAKVVTVSEFSKRRMVETMGLTADKIDVIYNGVANHFKPYAPAVIAETRAALKLPARYLLVQATSDRRKNLAKTMDAWRQVVGSLPEDLHLVVSGNLGRAHVFGETNELNLDAPRVHAIGYIAEEHMGPLMAGAEAFVFASLYEGFGLPVLEAMGSGTPVITGNATSLPEIAGGAALLVEARSTQAIAQAMFDIVTDANIRAKLVARGLSRVRSFTWDRAANQYAALFEAVATGKYKDLSGEDYLSVLGQRSSASQSTNL